MGGLIVLPETSPVNFPAHELVMKSPDGLLCVGGNLQVETLLKAYEYGVFPWYGEGQPILWWSPSTRAVFKVDEIYVSKNMRKLYRQKKYDIAFDSDFESVIERCAKRVDSSETWILPDVMDAYMNLFRLGVAHSVEVYEGATLVGGLYGVFIKNIFCGESMFSLRPNTSKLALFELANLLQHYGCQYIDCQLVNSHLQSLGVMAMSRDQFLNRFNSMEDNAELIKQRWWNAKFENRLIK